MLTLLQAMPGDYSLIFCLFYSIEQRLVNANIFLDITTHIDMVGELLL